MNDARIVVVTGAAQNIGAAIAARFLDNGDTVVCADLRAPDNTEVDYIETNVAEEASVEALMAAVADRYGRLDVLVNNAGICIETAIQNTSEDEWDRVMSVNVKSTFLTTKHARELLSAGPDRPTAIVNISSIEGLGANPLHAVYAASKAAVAGFTHNTALEYGPLGIRCNAVAPGWINTPFNEQLLAAYPDRQAVEQAVEALHPIGRLGAPEDVANTVFWLAGPESGFITGQEFVVDGGRLAKLPLPDL